MKVSDKQDTIGVLEIGAGRSPHPETDVTLDIREDLSHIDYPGVDISQDRWPLSDESVERAICQHVIEHVSPSDLSHVWNELDRVLVPGGHAEIELPHSGTWKAGTDPTHRGTGGTTPSIDQYFGNVSEASLEPYWPHLNWNVEAVAAMEWPLFVRPSRRFTWTIENGHRSMEIVKIPFVGATVHMRIEKQVDS